MGSSLYSPSRLSTVDVEGPCPARRDPCRGGLTDVQGGEKLDTGWSSEKEKSVWLDREVGRQASCLSTVTPPFSQVPPCPCPCRGERGGCCCRRDLLEPCPRPSPWSWRKSFHWRFMMTRCQCHVPRADVRTELSSWNYQFHVSLQISALWLLFTHSSLSSQLVNS